MDGIEIMTTIYKSGLTHPNIQDWLQTGEIIMRENVSQSKEILSLDSNSADDVLPNMLRGFNL